MVSYLFVVAFTIFIIGILGPIIVSSIYEYFFKKCAASTLNNKSLLVKFFRDKHLMSLANIFTEGRGQQILRKMCLILGITSIFVANILMLFTNFNSEQTRDLALFVGLWAATLISLASYLKD
jgi:hypothetical protein